MTQVLVTGGTGSLGRQLVPRLVAKGYEVKVLSRKANPNVIAGVQTVQGDLNTGAGLEGALEGAEVIAHCATGSGDSTLRGTTYRYARRVDVETTDRLLTKAKSKGSPHVVFISIVGVDKIPLGYYRAKLETEQLIERSGLPYSIFRTTQWHSFIDELCKRTARGPLVMVPKGFRVQLLDPGEVADRMASLVDAGPSHHVADMGGPKVLDVAYSVRSWLEAKGKRKPVVSVPIPGKASAGFRDGYNLTPEHADGRLTWEQWLRENVKT